MKTNISFFFILCVLLSCTDAEEILSSKDVSNATLTNANQLDIGPVNFAVWTELQAPVVPSYYYPNDRQNIFLMSVTGNYYAMWYMGDYVIYKLNTTTIHWEYLSLLGNAQSLKWEHQRLFSYQDKLYVGLGIRTDLPVPDPYGQRYFGAVDLETMTEVSLAPFPGTPARDVMSFIMGSKGYVAGGYSLSTNQALDQLWEYDIPSNQWTNKGRIPGGPRAGGSAFVMGNSVYYGLGYNFMDENKNTTRKKDWHVLNPETGFGTQLTSFIGQSRYDAQGFIMELQAG